MKMTADMIFKKEDWPKLSKTQQDALKKLKKDARDTRTPKQTRQANKTKTAPATTPTPATAPPIPTTFYAFPSSVAPSEMQQSIAP